MHLHIKNVLFSHQHIIVNVIVIIIK